jgi:hypothetical protein
MRGELDGSDVASVAFQNGNVLAVVTIPYPDSIVSRG